MFFLVRFLSTHSVRSATVFVFIIAQSLKISIHALRKECDGKAFYKVYHQVIFLSTHSVRSATVFDNDSIAIRIRFLSTHSVRSATNLFKDASLLISISIHALRKECDILQFFKKILDNNFYPRTP